MKKEIRVILNRLRNLMINGEMNTAFMVCRNLLFYLKMEVG